MAVRLLLRQEGVAHRAAAARAVHHRHRGFQNFRHAVGKMAGRDIGRAARAEHHRHLDRFAIGKILSRGGLNGECRQGRENERCLPTHGFKSPYQ
jgi:hypothetical protein